MQERQVEMSLHDIPHGTLVSVSYGNQIVLETVRFLYNSRIGVIQSGDHCGWLVMPFVERPTSKKHAAQFAGKKAHFSERLLFYPYPDVYRLFRMLQSGEAGYRRDKKGEFFRLEDALLSAKKLHAELLSMHSGNELVEREKALRQLIYEVMLYLTPRMRVEVKQEALGFIDGITSLRDSRARKNPTPLASKIESALRRLNKREDQIVSIGSIFALRKTVLIHVIEALDFQVNAATDFFSQLDAYWDQLIVQPKQVEACQARLYRLSSDFGDFDIAPYRVTFQYAQEECYQIIAALASKRFDEGRLVVKRALTGFQLRTLRSDLELSMQQVSRSKYFSDLPLDFLTTTEKIYDGLTRLRNLDTSRLRAFDTDEVQAFLESALQACKERNITDVHQALQQALVLL